ncbi:hypothetical protein BC834DRAFT_409251 [Gloeopeniophorella convolvens]|nr:hypothetical protein BC834DRAFT_409251 [Gloeopeniophorella convolvens]
MPSRDECSKPKCPDAGNSLYEDRRFIVTSSERFFSDIRMGLRLVSALPKQEWAQYATTGRVFGEYCRTIWWPDGCLAEYPQVSLIPPTHLVDKRGVRRSPDSAILRLKEPPEEGEDDAEEDLKLVTDRVLTGLCCWVEDKARGVNNPVWHDLQGDEARGNAAQLMAPYLQQLAEQALCAFSTYPGPGFYAFLVIGDRFSLLYYPRPGNWEELVTHYLNDSSRSIRSLPIGLTSQIKPVAKMFNEPMYNQTVTKFSSQMLYAFEKVSQFVEESGGEVQPSFFTPSRRKGSAAEPTKRRVRSRVSRSPSHSGGTSWDESEDLFLPTRRLCCRKLLRTSAKKPYLPQRSRWRYSASRSEPARRPQMNARMNAPIVAVPDLELCPWRLARGPYLSLAQTIPSLTPTMMPTRATSMR